MFQSEGGDSGFGRPLAEGRESSALEGGKRGSNGEVVGELGWG